MEEFKNQLIGQKEGLQFTLDLIRTLERSVENSIKTIDSKLKELK